MEPGAPPPPFRDSDPAPSVSVSPPPSHSTAATGSGRGPGPAKRRRNNATGIPTESCVTCRARKVKCSGNPGNGPCVNCVRLELVCSFVADNLATTGGKVSRTLPSKSHTEAGTVRKRAQRACQQCHLHKTKCSGDLPVCKRCAGASLNCEYMPAKRKFAAVPHQPTTDQSTKRERSREAQTSPGHQVDDPSRSTTVGASDRASSLDESDVEQLIAEKSLLNCQIILSHLDVWFRILHPVQCYSFFHPATTIREAEEQKFSSILAAGICSVAGLFIAPDAAGQKFTERCNVWVKFHLSRTVGTFTKDRLALLVLSSIYDFLVGDWPKVWEYSSTASRIVTAMQYNWDATTGSFIEQESVRRLVWQVYIMDRFLAGGFNEHLTLREEDIYLSLPCSDYAFRADHAVKPMERLDQRPPPNNPKHVDNVSILAITVRLFSVRHEILRVTKRYAMAPTQHPRGRPEASTVMEDIGRLQCRINQVKESLPDSLQISEINIQRQYGTPEWSSYLMLHTWIFQLHVDLYRFSLLGIREQATDDLLRMLPQGFLEKSRCQAIAFAITLAKFWESCMGFMNQQPQGPLAVVTADHVLTTCVVACTKIILVARQYRMFFDLQAHSTVPPFRVEEMDDAVLARLIESNVAILDQAEKVMPRIKSMSRDLREAIVNFQTAPEVDTPAMIGMPFIHPPENVRLPGPHYLLENLHAAQKVDDEANRQHSASLADKYIRKRSAASSRSSQMSSSPPVLSNRQLDYAMGPPGIPHFLSQARAGTATPFTRTADTAPAAIPSQEQPPQNQGYENYHFDISGVLAHIPSYSLVSPVMEMAVDGIPTTAYEMPTANPQAMVPGAMTPQEQFMLASQQQHMAMYGADYQMYNVPYRGYQ